MVVKRGVKMGKLEGFIEEVPISTSGGPAQCGDFHAPKHLILINLTC